MKPMLHWIADGRAPQVDGKISKGLSIQLNKADSPLFELNLNVHNETYHPDPKGLRSMWENLEELMRVVLNVQ
jgi:hypothetical protein